MLQINIPKPCHQDWNEMTPTIRGAFCSACAKEVIDFTTMTDAEVQNYFLQKATEKICGKFNNDQLNRIKINIPSNVFVGRIASWKKFMAVLLLAFGSMLFGCDVATDEALPLHPSIHEIEYVTKDAGNPYRGMVGGLAFSTYTVTTDSAIIPMKEECTVFADSYTTTGVMVPSIIEIDSIVNVVAPPNTTDSTGVVVNPKEVMDSSDCKQVRFY